MRESGQLTIPSKMLEHQCHTCKTELPKVVDQEIMEVCNKLMFKIKEDRHHNTLEQQKAKLDRLIMKEELINKGGHSKPLNMQRYMYQSGTDNSRTTASITTGTDTPANNQKNARPTTTTSTAMKSKSKCIINMSKKTLTDAQEKQLSHGPNYVVTPRCPPIVEYIAAVEQTCQNLTQREADEMRAEIKAAIKRSHPPRPNISREEQRALSKLKKDDTRVILTADKGVCLVVMDKEEYIGKAEELLREKTYKIIPIDPTNRQKNKLIQILKMIKEEGGMHESTYKKIYPTGASIPKFYGLPKIHKAEVPLRPIVSSRGSVLYNTAKELARILKPLTGRTTYSVQNTKDFVEQVKNIKLLPDECIILYDVKALFTSVPIEPAIKIIQQHLEDDQELQQRTSISVQHIIMPLESCLKNTHFIFQGRFYEQTEGAAMGSPLSPIIANLYMEAFEKKTISTSPTPPSLWRRFVDDTFVIIKKTQKDSFISHISSIHEKIKFYYGRQQRRWVHAFFWTPWSHHVQMAVKAQKSTGNQPTLICTCSGIATTPLQPNTVWSKLYAQINSC